MITLVIMAMVIIIGVPSFIDFIAAQRVRTTASDLMADMAFARAEAIKESRIVIVEPVGGAGTWKDGWRICADLDNGRDCDLPGEMRKASGPVSGRSRVCAVGGVDAGMLFRPDGRAFVRDGSAAVGAGDGIRVSDDLNDTNASNDRIRLVFLGVSGRASVEVQDGGTACP
jgi:type IV fimbrial biogenesis protein FimT